MKFFILFNHARRQFCRVVTAGAEECCDRTCGFVGAAVIRERARAGSKLYPRKSFGAFPVTHHNHSDFARSIGVRSATRSQVEAFDLNQPQFTVARRILTQGKLNGFCCGRARDGYLSIFPHDVVGQLDCAFDYFVGRVQQLEVDFADFVQHPKTARWRIEESYERLRKNVLAGVLLNVIESPRPINSSFDGCADFRRAPLNDVEHAVVFVINALQDAFAVECSGVARLAAAGGIKRGAIECDCSPATDAISFVSYEGFKLD